MSHIVSIATKVRDPVAIASACRRLGLPEPRQETVQLFSASATGLAVRLPGWRYPVVYDVTSGEARYDNFEGRWGDQREIDRFLQIYAAEKTKVEARKQGHTVTEQSLADGSLKLTIQMAGGTV